MLGLEIAQMQEILWDQNSETNKKIRHNKHNLFHMKSKMWDELREGITSIFNRVRDFNV